MIFKRLLAINNRFVHRPNHRHCTAVHFVHNLNVTAFQTLNFCTSPSEDLQESIKSSQIKSITNYKTISQLNISKPINYEALNNFEKLIKLTEIILEELADRFDDQVCFFVSLKIELN